jgi:hypothetical protein
MSLSTTCVASDSSGTVRKKYFTVSIQTVESLILADHIFITLSNVSSFCGNDKGKKTSS